MNYGSFAAQSPKSNPLDTLLIQKILRKIKAYEGRKRESEGDAQFKSGRVENDSKNNQIEALKQLLG